MKIKNFTEKQTRGKILSKVNPQKIRKSGHWMGYIYIGEKFITKVKIPNAHKKIMKESKSKFIARDLKLDESQFNDLIKCPISGKDYYKIIEKHI